MLNFSTQDYLLRSADVVFAPLTGLALVSLAAFAMHSLFERWLVQRRRLRILRSLNWGIGAAGICLLALGTLALLSVHVPLGVPDLVVQLSLGLGVLLSSYSIRMRTVLTKAVADEEQASPVWVVCLIVLVVISLFWAVANSAGRIGRERAEQLAGQLQSQPELVIYSKVRLHLDAQGWGVMEGETGDSRSAYPFRTTGLRLLIHSNDKYFMVPTQWTREAGVAIVLSDNDTIRVEFFTRGSA